MSVCCAAGLRVTAKASNMHPSGEGHVLPWESNPIFTRRRGGSKRGGKMPRGSHPRGLRPTCRWLGVWVLAIGLVPRGPLCIHYFPDLSDNRLSGVGSSDHTRLHGTPTWISNVDGMSGVCHDIVQDASRALHTCTRGEPTWSSIVDSMSGVCQNVPAIVFHPSTVDPVRSLASGCFWLDYADDCGCGQSIADLA
jgi:hypothetical protein